MYVCFRWQSATKTDLAELVQGGALVIDVRTPGEFAGGDIQGAVNIPYDEIAAKIGTVDADKSRVLP